MHDTGLLGERDQYSVEYIAANIESEIFNVTFHPIDP